MKILFRDSGQGIKKEHMDKIFDPFFTTKPPGKGTGLGLSIIKNIMGEHNGSITCASEPGVGACFELVLPLDKRKMGRE